MQLKQDTHQELVFIEMEAALGRTHGQRSWKAGIACSAARQQIDKRRCQRHRDLIDGPLGDACECIGAWLRQLRELPFMLTMVHGNTWTSRK